MRNIVDIDSNIVEPQELLKVEQSYLSIPRRNKLFRPIQFLLSNPGIPRFPRTYEQKKSRTLEGLLYGSSHTYAFVMPNLPPEIRQDVTVCYLIDRIIDIVEDTRIEEDRDEDLKTKQIILPKFIQALEDPTIERISDVREFFEVVRLNVRKKGYRNLLDNFTTVAMAVQDFSPVIKGHVLRYAHSMAKGLTDPEIQQIRTLDDHSRYTHKAAGLVGYQITRILQGRGFLSEENLEKLMPNPGLYKPGINPANDFALALQKVNDIKDLADDHKEGIRRWPSNIVAEHGLSFETLVNPSTVQEKYAAYEVLKTLINHATPLIYQANETYINQLPIRPAGIRIFCGLPLAMSAALLRTVDTPQFFTRKIRPSIFEMFDMEDVVTSLVEHGESLQPYLDHLLKDKQYSNSFRR